MPVDFQTVHIPIQSGMDEGKDSLNLPRGSLVYAQNVRFSKDGSAVKRPGHTLLCNRFNATTAISAGSGRLISNGDRLLLADGLRLHQYAVGSKTWSTKSVVPRHTGTSKSVASTNTVIAHSDQCIATGTNGREYQVVVYTEQTASGAWGGSVFARVFDSASGAEVNTTGGSSFPPTTSNTYQINSGALDCHNCQCVAIGTSTLNKVVVCYSDQNSNNIYYRVLNIDTMAWGAEGTVVANNILLGGVSNRFDMKPFGADVCLVYQDVGYEVVANWCTTSGTTLSSFTARILQDLSATGPVTPGTDTPASGFGVTPVRYLETSTSGSGYATHIWCTWGYFDGTRVVAVTQPMAIAGFLAVGSPVTIRQLAGLTQANGDWVVSSCSCVGSGALSAQLGFTLVNGYSAGNAGSTYSIGHTSYATFFSTVVLALPTTVTVSQDSYYLRAKLVSQPFFSGDRLFCVLQKETGLHVDNSRFNIFGSTTYPTISLALNQSTTFVADCQLGVEDACFFPRQSFISGDTTDAIIPFYLYRHVTQYVRADKLQFLCSVFDSLQSRCSLHRVTLTTSDAYRYHSYSTQEGAYIGGGLVGYMDVRSFMQCGSTYGGGYLTALSGGGAALTAGTSASAVIEVVDNDGNVQYSPIASLLDIGGKTLPVTLCAAYEWDGYDRYNAKDRTGFSSTGNASIVFYAGSSAASMYEVSRYPMAPYLTTFWASSGIVQTSNPAITVQPGPYQIGKQFIYTQGDVLEDEIPPASIGLTAYRGRIVTIDHTRRVLRFSKGLIPGERARFSDDFTLEMPFDAEAIHDLDGQCIVFGRNEIGVFSGDGPNDTGGGDEFGTIQVFATDLGCIDSRSIVKGPSGLMFQSPAGIYLLSRSLDVSYIGDRVRDTLVTYPVITSAIQHPTDTCVIFSANKSDGSAGVRLVYNYRFDRWSVDTVVAGSAITSQAVVGTNVYILTADGSIYVEDSTTGLDDGVWVQSKLTFASDKPAGAQAQHRFRCIGVLGSRTSLCNISVDISYDDEAGTTETKTFTDSSVDAILDLQFYPARQLARSFRVSVYDATPTSGTVTTGRGVTFSGLGLTVGSYANINRLPSTRRA